MILKFFKFLIKKCFRLFLKTIGFTTAMSLGPGLMLFVYLFDLHKPVSPMIENLPEDRIIAAQIFQGRMDAITEVEMSSSDFRMVLENMGFTLDPLRKNAVMKRRRLDCITTYSAVWTEDKGNIARAAGLVDRACPGINRQK